MQRARNVVAQCTAELVLQGLWIDGACVNNRRVQSRMRLQVGARAPVARPFPSVSNATEECVAGPRSQEGRETVCFFSYFFFFFFFVLY